MNAFAGIRPNFPRVGGQNPTLLAFFPGVCSGVICLLVGVQPPEPPSPPPIFTLPPALRDYSLSVNTFKQKLKTNCTDNDEHHPVPLWRFCDFWRHGTSIMPYLLTYLLM